MTLREHIYDLSINSYFHADRTRTSTGSITAALHNDGCLFLLQWPTSYVLKIKLLMADWRVWFVLPVVDLVRFQINTITKGF